MIGADFDRSMAGMIDFDFALDIEEHSELEDFVIDPETD